MKDLRIALIGSHSTGKTSIINELTRIIKLPVIEELARGYNLNTSNIYEYKFFQKQLLLKQIKSETSLILSNGSFISDRSSIDNVAYFLLKCKGVATVEERRRYCEIAKHNVLHYTHIFYIPIEIPLKSDGFRFEDELFRQQVDEKILQLIKYFDISVINLSGSLKERISKVLEAIEFR